MATAGATTEQYSNNSTKHKHNTGNNTLQTTTGNNTNGSGQTTNGHNLKKNKKKTKKKNSPQNQTGQSQSQSQTGAQTMQTALQTTPQVSLKSAQDENIWHLGDQEERVRIREFWIGLNENERRQLVKLEKEGSN